MARQRHRRGGAIGWPEALFVILVIATISPGLGLAIRPQEGAVFQEAPGYVTSGTRESVHYNAQPNEQKVTITFEYIVDGLNYDGRWSGFWPSLGSYNAVDPDNINSLLSGNVPITVMYDPEDPSVYQIHPESSLGWIVLMFLFGAGCVATFVYATVIYPRLR